MGFLRSFRGAFMDLSWYFHELSWCVRSVLMGLSLGFHDAFIGHSWSFRGASMGLFGGGCGLS